ncbi:DUF6343 family protein [Streptomyces sp. B1866]|uniref:DUF6343 family protein n=1 Tax=Streptomyces sp. B1866 TaxID=3075431 RepID=UPI00288EB65F|nr:DUF6343 family protein [Streptomyces sp. B1866]MDT3396851.1 DUF6343 family protein [Streptomyces sp. B1866]
MPRSRSGALGRRRERTGTEPATAQSALGLRLLLSLVAVPLFAAGTVLLAVWAASSDAGSSPSATDLAVLAAACGLLTLLAVGDLAVVLRRRSRERGRTGR